MSIVYKQRPGFQQDPITPVRLVLKPPTTPRLLHASAMRLLGCRGLRNPYIGISYTPTTPRLLHEVVGCGGLRNPYIGISLTPTTPQPP